MKAEAAINPYRVPSSTHQAVARRPKGDSSPGSSLAGAPDPLPRRSWHTHPSGSAHTAWRTMGDGAGDKLTSDQQRLQDGKDAEKRRLAEHDEAETRRRSEHDAAEQRRTDEREQHRKG